VETTYASLSEELGTRKSQNYLTVPFVVVAVVAEASLALTPGLDSIPATIFSVVLLVLAMVSFPLFANSPQKWTHVLVPLFYSGSVLALVIATGSSASGVGLVMLLAVGWSALYLETWKAFVVVTVVVINEYVLTIVPADVSDSVRFRRVLMFLLVSSLLVYSVHELRNRLGRASTQRQVLNDEMQVSIRVLEETVRCASVLGHLVDMLNGCNSRDEAYEVIEHAARSMFVAGGTVSAFDASKNQLETKCAWGSFPRDRQPFLTEDCWALRRGHDYESSKGEISCEHLRDSGEDHTICRPLLAQGEIMGVLTISIPDLESSLVSAIGNVDPLSQALLFAEQISIWMANFNLRETLQHQSIRDPLTNLFNRRFMEETLAREISKSTRTLEEISVIQIDIDHFKDFNDGHGHAVGDSTLCAISEVILALFRGSDVPCRTGGEEFTLLLPNCSWENARVRCVELQQRVAQLRISTPASRSPLQPPTLSIGIATTPEHGSTSEDILRSADLALYTAKSAGRNRISRAESLIAEVLTEVLVAESAHAVELDF
jgi:diguanylate cyclase (GGDEF)-like protein